MTIEDYTKLLSNQTKEALIQLLTKHTYNISEIKNNILADLGCLDEENEIKSLKQVIRKVIRQNKEYSYISWKGYQYIEKTAYDILNICDQRLEQRYVKMPISILLDLFQQLVKAEQYTEMRFEEVTTLICDRIHQCSARLSRENQADVVKKFVVTTVLNYAKKNIWQEFTQDDFNLLLTIVPLVTNQNKTRLLNTAEYLYQKEVSDYEQRYRSEMYTLFKISVFLQLGQRKQAEELMNEHINVDAIRMFKINLAFQEKDFKLAETLTLDKIHNFRGGDVHYLASWYACLDSIYIETNQIQKRVDSYKSLLFLGNAHTYYPLKELLIEEGFWEDSYDEIIEKVCSVLRYYELAPILVNENEIRRLFELIIQHPELVGSYGKYIYSEYPKEITDLFQQELQLLSSKASDRKKYRQVGKYILNFSSYGDKELAVRICEEWKQENPKRPALHEEMDATIQQINQLKK